MTPFMPTFAAGFCYGLALSAALAVVADGLLAWQNTKLGLPTRRSVPWVGAAWVGLLVAMALFAGRSGMTRPLQAYPLLTGLFLTQLVLDRRFTRDLAEGALYLWRSQ